MIIETKNALINIKQDYKTFYENLVLRDERELINSFEYTKENDILKTDYKLNYIAYDEIVFSKNGNWKSIGNYLQDIDINIKFVKEVKNDLRR